MNIQMKMIAHGNYKLKISILFLLCCRFLRLLFWSKITKTLKRLRVYIFLFSLFTFKIAERCFDSQYLLSVLTLPLLSAGAVCHLNDTFIILRSILHIIKKIRQYILDPDTCYSLIYYKLPRRFITIAESWLLQKSFCAILFQDITKLTNFY